MPVKPSEEELRELGAYLLAQLKAKASGDEIAFRTAACGVLSFAAEYGEAKCLAISEELDRRGFFARNGVPLIQKRA